nr:nuclear envelope phosphatase-regulatory subunit 1 isoform X3 [Zootoca vivipara]
MPSRCRADNFPAGPCCCALKQQTGPRETSRTVTVLLQDRGTLDLKAFERRLTEYIACLQPATGRWRIILIVVSVCTATGAWNWLIDPETQKVEADLWTDALEVSSGDSLAEYCARQ